MSFGTERLKIGIEENGRLSYLRNVNGNALTYEVGSEGDEFDSREGAMLVERLRKKEPQKTFVCVA